MNGVRLTRTMEWGGIVEGSEEYEQVQRKGRMEYKYGTFRKLGKKDR